MRRLAVELERGLFHEVAGLGRRHGLRRRALHVLRQREDVIDEEGEALLDLMDAEEGHGPMPVARPPPVPEDDLDAAMAAFDEAAAAAPSAPAAAPPTQDVAPTQLVPPTQDMECAPTQPVPPSQACDLVEESALEFNSQPSQLDDEEAEFQF